MVKYRIGMIYEGIEPSDRDIVEELYKINAISVLICTYKLSWDLHLYSYAVFILDPSRYDG